MMSDLCLKQVGLVLVRLEMHKNMLLHFRTASSARQKQKQTQDDSDDFLNRATLLKTRNE